MTRLYVIKDLPAEQAEQLDANFDVGGQGLGENQGAIFIKDGQTVVDFDSAAFAAFKGDEDEGYIGRITDFKKNNPSFFDTNLGKIYEPLFTAVTTDTIPADHLMASDGPAAAASAKATVDSSWLTLFGDDPAKSEPGIKKEWLEAYFASRFRAGDPDFQELALYRELAAFAKDGGASISRDELESLRSQYPAATAKIVGHFQKETSYSEHAFTSDADSFTMKIFIDEVTEQNTVQFVGADGLTIRQFYTSGGLLADAETGVALTRGPTDFLRVVPDRIGDDMATELIGGAIANFIRPDDAAAAEILADQLPKPASAPGP